MAGYCSRPVEKDVGASGKRKESQPSSSSGKKQRTSTLCGFQGHGRGYQGKAISGLQAS